MAAAIRISAAGIDADDLMSGAHWRKQWPEGVDDGNDDADVLNLGRDGRHKIKTEVKHTPFKWEWQYDEDVIGTQDSLSLAGSQVGGGDKAEGNATAPAGNATKPAEGDKKPKEEAKKEEKKGDDKKKPKEDKAAEEVIDKVKEAAAPKKDPWYKKRGMDIVYEFSDPTGNILAERRNPDGSLTK